MARAMFCAPWNETRQPTAGNGSAPSVVHQPGIIDWPGVDRPGRVADHVAMAEQTNRWAGLAWAAAVIVIVAGVVAGVGWFGPWKQADEATGETPGPPAVAAEGDYYLFVRLVEFKPTQPGGDSWDAGDDSAPDPRVKIYWQNQRVFTLPDREDQLIAAWDLFRVDVKDLVLSGGEVDVGAVVNAPIVRIAPDASVTIEVWDDDPMLSDRALKITIPLTDLVEGPNLITPPTDSGIARLRLDMISRATALPELLEMESSRD